MSEANTGLPIEIERIEVDERTAQSVYQAGYSRITVKSIVEGTHEPIIDRETWDRVQKRIEGPGHHVQRKLIVSNSWHNRASWIDQP